MSVQFFPTYEQVLRSKFGGLVFPVTEYGADPTGVQDSTDAIQAAVVQAQNSGYGGVIWLGVGSRYLVSAPIEITGENIHFRGPGWSMPQAGATNPVSRGTPLAVLTPSSDSFPANSPVLDFNNPNYMINGCSVKGVTFQGNTYAHLSNNVSAIHFGNAAFFEVADTIIFGMTGSGLVIDEAGAAYGAPSTSQMTLKNLYMMNVGTHGILFADDLFISAVYIHSFWIHLAGGGDGIHLGATTGGSGGVHISDGLVAGAIDGVYVGMAGVDIHDLTLHDNYGNGILYASTTNNGYISKIHHNTFRDNDINANGSAGLTVATGSYNLLLDHNVAEKVNRTPEYGFLSVDGFNDTVHNVYLDRSNYAAGNSVANYKSGAYEVTSARFSMGPRTVAVPASGTATAALPYDATFYITQATAASSVAVQGQVIDIPIGGPTAIRVPAGQTLTPTYTTAPTWVVMGD